MQNAPGFLLVLVFLIVVAILALSSYTHHHQTRQMLLRIANRFQGRVELTDAFSSPQVRLKFQGYSALLKYVRVGKQTHTAFTITWPDDRFRCEIYPQDIFSGFRKLWGMEDIEIGSPQFDSAYFIAGSDKAAIRDLLTGEVQSIIFRLSALGFANFYATREIQVRWSGGVMTVAKPSRLTTFESLEQFLSLCGLLFAAAIETKTSGIEFVGDAREPDTAEAQCQVCGEALGSGDAAGDLVYCSACETPHHRECWQYFGGCSTYACGQKKFVTQVKQQRRKAS
jgi:hypothetical protein